MTSPHTAQHDDTDGPESTAVPPVYPLFPDAPFGAIDYIIAQRVIDDSAARPGSDKRTRYQVWPDRFDPITTDEVTIAERCGGGTYDLRAVGAKGRTVGGMRLEFMGKPKEFVPPEAPTKPSPCPFSRRTSLILPLSMCNRAPMSTDVLDVHEHDLVEPADPVAARLGVVVEREPS